MYTFSKFPKKSFSKRSINFAKLLQLARTPQLFQTSIGSFFFLFTAPFSLQLSRDGLINQILLKYFDFSEEAKIKINSIYVLHNIHLVNM